MASEAPFDRLGRIVAEPRVERRIRLFGSPYENAFTVAHRALGEWRAWRELCENNNVLDPLDLRAPTLEADGAFVIEDGAVDISLQLGQRLVIEGASEPFPDGSELVIEDISETQYTLALNGGTPVVLDFATVAQGGEQTVTVTGPTNEFLDLRYDSDAFMIMWLMRCIPVAARTVPSVYEIVAPSRVLGALALGET